MLEGERVKRSLGQEDPVQRVLKGQNFSLSNWTLQSNNRDKNKNEYPPKTKPQKYVSLSLLEPQLETYLKENTIFCLS